MAGRGHRARSSRGGVVFAAANGHGRDSMMMEPGTHKRPGGAAAQPLVPPGARFRLAARGTHQTASTPVIGRRAVTPFSPAALDRVLRPPARPAVDKGLRIAFLDAASVDKAAWDSDVCVNTGNPTQLHAFSALGGKWHRPIYAEARRGDTVVLRWLLYEAGLPPFLRYLDVQSEPTSDDPTLIAAVLSAAEARFRPFEIRFHDVLRNRWRDAGMLRRLGFDEIRHHGTFALDLQRGPERLFREMHKTQRNRIQRARRAGITVTEVGAREGLRRMQPILNAALARSGQRPPSLMQLVGSAEALCRDGHGRLFVAERDGIDHGAVFDLVTPRCALAWVGATAAGAPPGTGNLLQWSAIETLARDGVAHYDLGGVELAAAPGSKGARIYESKRKYGGRLSHHYGGVKVCAPARARIWRRLAGAVAGPG